MEWRNLVVKLGDGFMRTDSRMGWEDDLVLQELKEEAMELERVPIQPGPKARKCTDPRIPKIEPYRSLGRVDCAQASAFNVSNPLSVLSKARMRAVEMLNNTINELINARRAVCAGATPAWPLLGDATLCWLNRGLSVNTDNIRVWSAHSFEPIRSVAEVIRRLIRVRNLIASSGLRYSCTSPDCEPGDWAFVTARDQVTGECLPGTPLMLIRLCRNFWVPGVIRDKNGHCIRDARGVCKKVPPKIHADFQAQTIIHEASHLTHCNHKEIGHTIALPECLAQFVAATNGSWLDSDFVTNCIGTKPCRPPAGGVEVFQREISASRALGRKRILRTAFRPQNAVRFKGRPAARR
jgi:hypothetical protein